MKHSLRLPSLLALATVGLSLTQPAPAGIPVIDGGNVTIPRQSRGLSFVSRSKRLRGR